MLIDRLHYALGLDTSEFKRGWASANNLMGSMDTRLKSLATGAGIAGLALALGKIGTTAVNMARELGSAMNEVWSIMDKNREEMQGISAEILNLSRNIPESAPALAKAYYQVISAGITDAAEAMDVLSISSRAATAGLTTTFTTVDAITNVLNAYNLETKEAQEISDDFFISVRDGKMTMEQLAPAIGQVVGTAALAKVELKEVLAAMVAMTLAGYSVDESATSMNRLLLSIVNTQDDAKEAAKSVGIEWSVAGLQAKGFQGFIKDLNDKAGDNIELLQAMVPEIRAFRAAAVIAGTGADNYARSLNNLKNSAGATDQALSKIMSGTGKQWQLVKNQLNASMIELGQRILPAVKTAVEFVADGFEALGLTGETEARRLQREWQFVGKTIASVGDIAARAAAIQKALSLLMAPGQDTLKIYEEVKGFFTAFPVLSERAKQIQDQRTISAGELVEALMAEAEYLKEIADASNAAQLQDKQRLVTTKELAGYQQQILAMQRQAKTVGDEATYKKLAEIADKLRASQEQWTDAKREGLLLDNQSIVNQITMAQAAAAAEESQKELKVNLADTSQRLLVSEARLVELEQIKKDLAKETAKAAREAAEARADELEKMKAMQGQKWSFSSGKSEVAKGGLPYGQVAVPEEHELKVFNNEMEKLWATFFYGEDATQNLTSASMKLADALFEGDEAASEFATGIIEMASGLATSNPLGVFQGLVDIFSGLFGSGKKAGDATKTLTERIKEYTDQLQDMTYAQLQQQMNELVGWWNALKTPMERAAYKDIFQAKMQALADQLKNFGKWGDDFASMIERWNYEVRLLDIEDPAQKFQMLVRYAKQYLGVDLPTEIEDGFEKVKKLLGSLGAGNTFKQAWETAFGTAFPLEMTEEQLRELIELYQKSLKEMKDWREETAGEIASATSEESVAFTRTKQITYRQAEEMTLALWSTNDLTRSIYNLLNARLTSEGVTVQQPAGEEPASAPEWPGLNDIITKLNLYVTNCYVSTQNALVDVIKANVYIGGTTFVPDTYGGMIYKESDRVLRSKGEPWPI